jgi:hypothetical protein
METSGAPRVATWESLTRSAVTTCRFLHELAPRGSSIAARIVVRSFHESAACTAHSRALPAAGRITGGNSTRVFGYDWFVMSSEVETCLNVSEMPRDSSTPLGMTDALVALSANRGYNTSLPSPLFAFSPRNFACINTSMSPSITSCTLLVSAPVR